jgi:NAD(P)H-quinone oxidoreductase subunit 5
MTVTWFQAYDFNLSFALDVSMASAAVSVLVSGISLIAQVYGLGSMEMDYALARFYALMGFFEGAISGIALSDSLFLSYALLEMLTLSTYLLVGFWYVQPLVVAAARDAFWTKRVGDLFLLMGVVALSAITDSLNFSDLKVWAASPETRAYFASNPQVATLLGLALIAGPTGKCAQVPLHLWIDEAMEGPNPASILRNSVVVGAGAYVLIKLQPVLALSPVVDGALVAIGSITAIGASLVAVAQIDAKRALCHSTSAYLGLVFIAVGLQQPDIAMGLLLSHGLAKSLLFMSLGSVMMTIFTKDLTEMGGLWSRMPVTMLAFVVGTLGLVAFVPLGGFGVLLQWQEAFWDKHYWAVIVALLVNAITAFGLMRVFSLMFLGYTKPKTRRSPEVSWQVALPMVSLLVVVLHTPLMLPQWNPVRHLWLAVDTPAIMSLVGSSLAGFGLGIWIYIKQNYAVGSTVPLPPPVTRTIWQGVQRFVADDLEVRALYKWTVVLVVRRGSDFLSWVDRHLVDGVVNFFGFASIFSGESLKYTSSGRSQQYILTILVGVLVVALLSFYFAEAAIN